MNSIPEKWIKEYVDTLIAYAAKIGPDTAMGKAALERADHAMDLVKGYRERSKEDAREQDCNRATGG